MTALYSIGHGNRGIKAFIELLQASDVQCLVDVRAYPRSKRHPQYTRLRLEPELQAHGIRYLWEGATLGGMRRPQSDSPHAALADVAFRGYADHMASGEFAQGLGRLLELGTATRTAFMCAETDPRHCHRSFIADALLARGVEVLHLIESHDVRCHALRAGARCAASGELIYDTSVQLQLAL